jgi:hypothetical protein
VSLTTGELEFQNGFDLKFRGVRIAWKASHGVTIYVWICDRVFESCFTKGAIHMTKKLMLAAMLTAALSAGAISVRQL